MKPRQILCRINAIQRIVKITRAMEIVASTQLRKLELKFTPVKEYFNILEDIVRQIYISYHNLPNIWLRPRSDDNILIVVIGSDRGLCGSFNFELLAKVKELIQQLEADNKKVIDIIPVGKKCTSYCRRIYEKEGLVNYSGREQEVVKILKDKIITSYREEKVDNVVGISTLYKKSGKEKIKVEKLLPIEFEDSHQKVRNIDWILEPYWESLLDLVIPAFLEFRLLSILMESRLAEELSRMLAMKYSKENGEDMIDNLTLKYHRARQAQITTEILEITQGVEAAI